MMKKKRTVEPTSVGHFEILKESKETYAKWDVDMSDNFYQFCLERGNKEVKKNPSLIVQIGFVSMLEAAATSSIASSTKGLKKKATK